MPSVLTIRLDERIKTIFHEIKEIREIVETIQADNKKIFEILTQHNYRIKDAEKKCNRSFGVTLGKIIDWLFSRR